MFTILCIMQKKNHVKNTLCFNFNLIFVKKKYKTILIPKHGRLHKQLQLLCEIKYKKKT